MLSLFDKNTLEEVKALGYMDIVYYYQHSYSSLSTIKKKINSIFRINKDLNTYFYISF